jgi:heme/copper-type cytochrome/quinol oxidase subunit 1
MTPAGSSAGSSDHAPGSHAGEHAHPQGWRRWLFATNHKDIGAIMPAFVGFANWMIPPQMWKGSLSFESPMLFAVGYIWVFTIGGFTGLILSVAPIDVQVQDTYYVVTHFHYVLVAGSLFALFSGYYYWAPKWTGDMIDERQVYWLFRVVIPNVRGGAPAPPKPWEGTEGLEWTVPSPAPFHTFETPPLVK